MATLPVVNNAVPLSTAEIAPTDTFQNGVLLTSAGAVVAISSGGDEYSNGLLRTDAGQLRYTDATAGLPSDTTFSNGVPLSGGALCISTNPATTYSNGLPMAANGAVAVTIS